MSGSSTGPTADPSLSATKTSDTRTFERWRKTFGVITGLGLSEDERAAEMQAHHGRTCEQWKRQLMNYSPSVVFMLKQLGIEGANVRAEHIQCTPCDATRAGGFSPEAGAVVLCAGRFFNKNHMEDTLVHELVHMYDHAKFKVNWADLRHHACSEIRANSLSGDCKFTREMRRGKFAFSKQHQACVRRRAILSVRANPACPNEAAAERAVNEVWESCFNDTRPFDEIY